MFLLAACGRSETDRESDRLANAANPAGLSPGKGGLSAIITSGSFAAVSADESRAAEIGRDILQSGGNATDAATAMYFALAVTLPSAAGLGASGACIVHDDKTKAAEAFVFPPIAAPGTINGQSFSVPSGVRGIMLMHIRHGQLRWEQMVAPAERLARFGVPVSRALSRDLQAGAGLLGGDRETRRIFGKGTGGMVAEGDIWTQSDLAGTLGAIRQRGGGDFFQGTLARTLSDQVSQMGGSLPLEALRNAVPQARAADHRDRYRPPQGLCRAAAGCRRRGAGRLERPGAGRPDAGRFRRLLRPGRGRQQGAAQPPAPCRWASSSARARSCPAPACCWARPRPMRRRSAR